MEVSRSKAPPVQTAPPPKRVEVARHEKNSEAKSQTPEVKNTPEARPAPVVNTQGQTTGRILNVTA